MALGTPDQVKAFSLGGFTLEAMAPEEFRTGLTATFKFFFFKSGDPVVQKGRVTPDPITLSFRLHGPDAVDAELFLRAMAAQQKEIDLAWLGRFSFRGYLTQVGDFSHTRLWATGSITFQPTKDTSQAGNGAALESKFQRSGLPIGNWLDALKDAANALNGFIADLREQVDSVFQPLVDIKAALDLVNTEIQLAVEAAGSVLAIPYQTASELASSIDDTLGALPAARDSLFDTVLAPTIPLLQGTSAKLAEAAGLGALVALDDADDALLNLANTLAPEPLAYRSQYGETTQDVADIFEVALPDLLALNSNLGAGPIPAGTVVRIPPA